MKTATRLSRSFIKIKNLSDEMFSTGNIRTTDYCLEVYRQYISGERFNHFLWNAWEIERTLSLLQPKLIKFKKETIKLFIQIKKLINKDSIAKLTPYKLQRLFINDLKKQFRKVIIKDGKYKSDFCRCFREIEIRYRSNFYWIFFLNWRFHFLLYIFWFSFMLNISTFTMDVILKVK